MSCAAIAADYPAVPKQTMQLQEVVEAPAKKIAQDNQLADACGIQKVPLATGQRNQFVCGIAGKDLRMLEAAR